jgi:hypothetical protein
MSIERFEIENAKALLAAETDRRKRRALQDRIAFYQHQLDRIEQHQGRRNESRKTP